MPVPYLKKIAKSTGKTISDLEKMWNDAKKLADKSKGKSSEVYWPTVVSIFKKMAKVDESVFLLSKISGRISFNEQCKTIKSVNKFNIVKGDIIEISDSDDIEQLFGRMDKNAVCMRAVIGTNGKVYACTGSLLHDMLVDELKIECFAKILFEFNTKKMIFKFRIDDDTMIKRFTKILLPSGYKLDLWDITTEK